MGLILGLISVLYVPRNLLGLILGFNIKFNIGFNIGFIIGVQYWGSISVLDVPRSLHHWGSILGFNIEFDIRLNCSMEHFFPSIKSFILNNSYEIVYYEQEFCKSNKTPRF